MRYLYFCVIINCYKIFYFIMEVNLSIFVIGDLHLSFGVEKPMDIFQGWENHWQRIEKNWRKLVKDTDMVLLIGSHSVIPSTIPNKIAFKNSNILFLSFKHISYLYICTMKCFINISLNDLDILSLQIYEVLPSFFPLSLYRYNMPF